MDIDGFDFVFVVFDELTKTGDRRFGALFGFGIKAGGQQLVACEFVDHLILGPQQNITEQWILKREQGSVDLVGLDDAGDFAVNVETVVSFAGVELKFAHGDARAGHDVHVRHVLDNPTAVNKLLVDVLAGVVFGGQMKTDGERWKEAGTVYPIGFALRVVQEK